MNKPHIYAALFSIIPLACIVSALIVILYNLDYQKAIWESNFQQIPLACFGVAALISLMPFQIMSSGRKDKELFISGCRMCFGSIVFLSGTILLQACGFWLDMNGNLVPTDKPLKYLFIAAKVFAFVTWCLGTLDFAKGLGTFAYFLGKIVHEEDEKNGDL